MKQLRLLSLLAIGLAAGCAHAEFDLIEPADLAQHVGTRQTTNLTIPPVEYWLSAYEDHLVMRIYNRSASTIRLAAGQSVVVDPRGQSHPVPVPNAPILPGTFVKLILPPVGPRLVPTGPTIGIGFGTVISDSGRQGWGAAYRYDYRWGYDPFWYRPRYYVMYGGDDGFGWAWPDGGSARLILVYVQELLPAPPGPATRPADTSPPAPAPTGTFALPAPPAPGTFTHQFVFRRKNV